MKFTKRSIGFALAALAVVAFLAWWAWPAPRVVETARVARGMVQVTIEEDGETRAIDRYGIAAPVAGRLLRVALREGDAVKAGQVVAEIAPLPLSAAERDMLEAKLEAAQAMRTESAGRVARAEADAAQAQREKVRVADLVAKKFMSDQALEQAEVAAKTSAADLAAAKSRAAAAAAEVEASRATLAAVRAKAPTVPVASPVNGRVLRIPDRSERVVQAGALLATVGDPRVLEIVVDVLSNDAVRVRPGMPMLLTGWGGPDLVSDYRRRLSATLY